MTSYLTPHADGLRLTVHTQPKASRTRIAGFHGTALKVAVAAPPVEGKANKALRDFLARFFSLPLTHVQIAGGEHSRTKVILLQGIAFAEARQKIIAAAGVEPAVVTEKTAHPSLL